MKKYQITVDGKQYVGKAEDVARWYCLEKGIKLYIKDLDNGSMGLCELYPGDDYLSVVGYFEGDEVDANLESGYRVFFIDCLQDNPDCKIVEVNELNDEVQSHVDDFGEVQPPTDDVREGMLKLLQRPYPDRDAVFGATAQIASAAIKRGNLSSEVSAVVEYVKELYPRLLNVRHAIQRN